VSPDVGGAKDAKKFAKIEFNSTDVKRDGASKKYSVTGTLSMHGVQRKLEMPMTMVGIGKGPMGKTRGGFVTKFTLQRSDFGIDSMPKVIGDQIAVTFSFEALLMDAPPDDFNRFIDKK
jgi:polyisoprenoid-binding protein YceI